MKKRGNFSPAFKAKVGCAALCESKTTNELSAEHGVHGTQIHKWRKVITEESPRLFEGKSQKPKRSDVDVAELQRIVGEQAIQLAWYKKKLNHLN